MHKADGFPEREAVPQQQFEVEFTVDSNGNPQLLQPGQPRPDSYLIRRAPLIHRPDVLNLYLDQNPQLALPFFEKFLVAKTDGILEILNLQEKSDFDEKFLKDTGALIEKYLMVVFTKTSIPEKDKENFFDALKRHTTVLNLLERKGYFSLQQIQNLQKSRQQSPKPHPEQVENRYQKTQNLIDNLNKNDLRDVGTALNLLASKIQGQPEPLLMHYWVSDEQLKDLAKVIAEKVMSTNDPLVQVTSVPSWNTQPQNVSGSHIQKLRHSYNELGWNNRQVIVNGQRVDQETLQEPLVRMKILFGREPVTVTAIMAQTNLTT